MSKQQIGDNLEETPGTCEATMPVRTPLRSQVWLMRVWELRGQMVVGTVNRRIFSAAMVVGALTLFAKVAGMGKEVLVAAWFGTGDAMDAFVVAFLIPSYAINVIAGSINGAFIPTFIEVRERAGDEAAQRLFSGTLVFSIGLLTLSVLLMAAAAPWVIPLLCFGFTPTKVSLTLELFYLLVPGVLIVGVAMCCEAALNAGERFALAALAPGVVPLMIMAAVTVAGSRCGINALAFGMLAGFVVEFAVAAFSLRKRGLFFVPRWHGLDPDVRRVMRQYFPAVVASGLMCSTLLVDQAMASMLPPGSVSALNYGNKIVALGLTIGTMAFGTAMLPYLSKMVTAEDWVGLRHTLKTYLRLILMTTIPFVVAGALLSKPLVALLFERGRFTEADTARVAWIQVMYLVQVPFYSLTILFVRVISALKANDLLMWGTVTSVGVNVTMNFVLMRWLGVAGIALSTSVVYIVLSGFLGLVLCRKLKAVSVKIPCK